MANIIIYITRKDDTSNRIQKRGVFKKDKIIVSM
jgi:hypothetical protein